MENSSSSRYSSVFEHYAGKMMKISMSIGVIWAMSSICLTIILLLVFVQDQWIGDTQESKGSGHFGLWKWCSEGSDGREVCQGDLGSFSSILSPAFRASTVFSGLSVIVTVVSLVSWISVCCISASGLFKFSGSLQLISGVFMLIVLLSYPAGWDNFNVSNICGSGADDFLLGTCDIRWSYMLAAVACCDAFLLGFLALTLGFKQIIKDEKETDSLTPGYLINNITELGPSQDIKNQPIMISNERLTSGVSRDSLFTQNNLLL